MYIRTSLTAECRKGHFYAACGRAFKLWTLNCLAVGGNFNSFSLK